MREFDLLFYKGDGFISKIIKKVTAPPYSHVALVLDNYHVVEADWKHPLSIRHISYSSWDYDIYRVEGLTEEHKEKIRRYINETISAGYDYKLVLSHLFKYFFKGKLLNSPSRYDCSEWVTLAFLYAGIELLPNKQPFEVAPSDLLKSPRLKLVKDLDK